MSKKHNIAILVETSTNWGRRLCQGIGNYASQNTDWNFYLEPHGENEVFFLPKGWSGDGIIARVNRPDIYENVARRGIPIVNISGQVLPGVELPRVAPNDKATITMAVEHLLEKGIKNFAYSGYSYYSEKRYEICSKILMGYGQTCFLNPESGTWSESIWGDRLKNSAEWIKQLPKPVGIIAWGTVEGRHLADACQYAGVKIPEEVSIIGWDFDDLIGEMIKPSITGVALPTIQQGFEAAKMLDTMIQGKTPMKSEIWLDPIGVVSRESTDFIAIEDEEVKKALYFIRENACDNIDVSDVVKGLSVSRRTLERRFVSNVGRTPAEEIRRIRFECAKDMLIKTTMSVQEVATASGWRYAEQMIPYFKSLTGMTPLEYRKKLQAR